MTDTTRPQAGGALVLAVMAGILFLFQVGLVVREGSRHERAVKGAQEEQVRLASERADALKKRAAASKSARGRGAESNPDRYQDYYVVDSSPSGAEVLAVMPSGPPTPLGTTPLVIAAGQQGSRPTRVLLRRTGYSGEWVVPGAGVSLESDVQSTPLAPAVPLASALLFVYPWGTLAMLSLGAAAWVKKRSARLAADLEDATDEIAYTDEGGRIGEYRLLRLLGEGGMAEVFLGQAVAPVVGGSPGKGASLVAVKVMREELCNDPEFRKRIDREVAIARSLVDPHIVPLLGSGEDRGRLFMVMEYVKGSNLRDHLDALGGSPMAPREAVSLLLPVVSALSYAHGKGVVHRDLKPENILLTEGGVPKVTDFGMARANESETLTATGMFLGTPSYMAPEQVSNPRTTPRADIYSLGCILYEMLAGRLPFTGGFEEIVMKRLTEDPPPLRTFCATVPPPLEQFVMRMVHPDPDERPASCDEVSQGLKALLPRLPAGR